MSYTTAELVKKQAVAPRSALEQQSTQEVTLSGSAPVSITSNAIVSGTLQALAVTQLAPASEAITFSSATITLPSKPLSPGSVTVADTESLGTIHLEGTDYVVDYQAGTVSRITGGAIGAGDRAHVWYFPFHVFVEGADYQVDHSAGTVRHVAGGQIPDGARILISFSYTVHGIDDKTYSEAANEANQMVSAAVDPSGEFGADLNLQTAATFLASAIICRIAATAALAGGARGSDASLWLDLSASFQKDATRLLETFKPPRRSLEAPRNA
jgi:hypothetical protein